MKKTLVSLVAAASIFSASASADMLGVEIGGAIWAPEASGDFKYDGNTMDLEKDLGFGGKESANNLWLSFEHPVPVVPNFKIIQTNLEMDASKTKSITFAGRTYATGENKTDLVLNQTDFIAYYELSEGLVIPFVHLDLGIAIKSLDGKIAIKNDSLGYDESKEFSAPIPMIYGKVKLSTSAIPFIPVDVEYETLQLSIGKNSFKDTKIGLVYDVELFAGFNVGAVAGLREENIEIDQSSVKANIDISGYYFGAYFNW